MSTVTSRDKREDMVDEATSALENLIPTPETIWGGISKTKLKAADGDTMREICWLSYDDFNRFQQAVKPAARKMDMVLFVRAVVFKAEASKIDGFLAGEFDAAKIVMANNTDADTAVNAAIYRLLTKTDNARSDDKYRVSRGAKAMKGIEITCEDAGIAISFATAGKILGMVERSSRSELCKLVDDRAKPDAENAIEESASSQAEESEDQQQPTSEIDAGSERNDHESAAAGEEAAEETTRRTVAAPSIAPELFAPLDRKDVDTIPEDDLHLVAFVRDGQNLVLKGVVCSGEKARALIQKAMAG